MTAQQVGHPLEETGGQLITVGHTSGHAMVGAGRHNRGGRTALLVVAAVTTLFACSSDGGSPFSSVEVPQVAPDESGPEEPARELSAPGDTAPRESAPEPSVPEEPAPDQPAPDQPAPDQPAPEQPAPEQPAPEQPAPDDGLTSGQWVFIVLGGLLLIAAIAAIAAQLSRRPRGGPGTATPEQMRLDGVLRRARQFDDSTVFTVLQPNDPAGLQSVWSVGQRELIELESQVGGLVAVVDDAAALQVLHALADALSGLRGALDANVRLRLSGERSEQAALVDASNQTALSRRAELDAALLQASQIRL